MSHQVNRWRVVTHRANVVAAWAVVSLLLSLVWAILYPAVNFGYGFGWAAVTALWVIVSGVVFVESRVAAYRIHRPLR